MIDLLLIAAVFVLGIVVGYRLRAADLAAWAVQSTRRDLHRRGLAVPSRDILLDGMDLQARTEVGGAPCAERRELLDREGAP